uniref:Uncharacterized protein n=1 Tax=Poecilia mexicana TaxID=48701 RepID=A0A3B3Y6A0_9TELE
KQENELQTVVMSSSMYVEYRGLLLPPVGHNAESLEFAQNFSVEDSDVFAVTYPKSGPLTDRGPPHKKYIFIYLQK